MSSISLANYSHILNAALSTEGLWPLLESLGQLKQYPAGHTLIAVNTRPQCCYVLLEGLVRQFYRSEDGRERNKNFFREGQLVGSLSALLTQGPCPYEVQCLESCEVLEIPVNAMLESTGSAPAVQQMIDTTTRELFLRNEHREAVLLTKSAEERYRWLLTNEAWISERLAQYQVASYLGMDAVSLSRIKRGFDNA